MAEIPRRFFDNPVDRVNQPRYHSETTGTNPERKVKMTVKMSRSELAAHLKAKYGIVVTILKGKRKVRFDRTNPEARAAVKRLKNL